MFISGFFGMNTADIRDTDANQTLYWMISIPVTVLTLLAAFAYGYKGDEIGDRLYDIYRRLRRNAFPAHAHSQSTIATAAPPPGGFRRRPTGILPLSEPRRETTKTQSSSVEEAGFKSALWESTKVMSIRRRGSPPNSTSRNQEAIQSSSALGKEE